MMHRLLFLSTSAFVGALIMLNVLTMPDEPKHIEEAPDSSIVEEVVIEPVESEPVVPPVEEVAPVVVNMGEFKVTAYCSCETCCGKWALNRPVGDDGKPIVYGAAGVELAAGRSVAVDPKLIPYGSTVFIDGVEYIAEDTGGGIKGNRLDIYYDSHQAAREWGVRHCNVDVIYKEG